MGAAGPQGPPEARLPLAPPGFTALAQHKADKQLRGLAERPRGGAAGAVPSPRCSRDAGSPACTRKILGPSKVGWTPFALGP